MKREELCNELREPYTKKRGCGVVKVDHPDYQNIWFVVLPPIPENYRPPKNMRQLVNASAKANAVLNKLGSYEQMSELDKVLSYLFVRREAVSSSRMEGTWSTIDEVLTPLGDEDRNTVSATASVRGYAQALEKYFAIVRAKRFKAFTQKLVCDLHKTIVSKDPSYQGIPGRIRNPGKPRSIVLIGGMHRKEESIFNPTPPQYVDDRLKDYTTWQQNDLITEMGDAGQGMPLVVRMAISHIHFEAIHPFSDGNGRVGRMLWPLQMILSDYQPLYLSGYVEAEKQAYYKALEEGQKRLNYLPFIEFLSEAFAASYEDTQKSKNALIQLPEQWRKRVTFRQGSVGQRILDRLVESPMVSISKLSEELKIAFPNVSLAIQKLVDHRILKERTGFQKYRLFAAEEVIAVLTRKFGEDPKDAIATAREIIHNHKT